jgi:hypothetical protein
MINGYDLDGVLAVAPPLATKPWNRMNAAERASRREFLVIWYKCAKPLITPSDMKFVVITARKDVPEVRRATERWLKKYFPKQTIRLYMLKEARTMVNNVNFKAEVIRREKLLTFVEDNIQVVRELRKRCKAKIFYFNGRTMEAD